MAWLPFPLDCPSFCSFLRFFVVGRLPTLRMFFFEVGVSRVGIFDGCNVYFAPSPSLDSFPFCRRFMSKPLLPFECIRRCVGGVYFFFFVQFSPTLRSPMLLSSPSSCRFLFFLRVRSLLFFCVPVASFFTLPHCLPYFFSLPSSLPSGKDKTLRSIFWKFGFCSPTLSHSVMFFGPPVVGPSFFFGVTCFWWCFFPHSRLPLASFHFPLFPFPHHVFFPFLVLFVFSLTLPPPRPGTPFLGPPRRCLLFVSFLHFPQQACVDSTLMRTRSSLSLFTFSTLSVA